MESLKLKLCLPQTRNSPIIVGDQYELAEILAASYSGEPCGGLLPESGVDAALLSMSGYEKPYHANLNDFDTRRTSATFKDLTIYNAAPTPQEPMYTQYSLPGLADPELQPSPTAYDQQGSHLTYGASSDHQPQASYQVMEQSYGDYDSRKPPQSSSYTPHHGVHDTLVYVYLDSVPELLDPSSLIANLMFGNYRVPASFSRLESQPQDICYKYVVAGHAPPFSNTASTSARVALRVQFQESSGLNAGMIDVGPWFYQDSQPLEMRPSPENIRKRKMAQDTIDVSIAPKRLSPSQPSPGKDEGYGRYSFANTSMEYPQGLHPIDMSSMQRKLTPYGMSQEDSTELNNHSFSDTAATTQSLMKPPLTQSSIYSPSYPSMYQTRRSPGLSSKASFRISSSPSPNPANPPLVRASILQQQSGPASTSGTPSVESTFNAYVMYPSRATIRICGDLNVMQDEWTPEERSAKRRLVRFRGEQTGSTINTYFKAVKPDERSSPHGARERLVSCIYREETDEYFVTSVDTIALLETLVDARFTVEEKNRIRRNLETHHPSTISKGKADTEDFFKVIMGFPNPKPRNIEKDVKVFPWSILAQALRKVISKYSASPASTAGPLSTSRGSNYSGALSDTGSAHYGHISSRSSTGSSSYASTFKSSNLSPPTASHGLATKYPQSSLLPSSIPHPPQNYNAPSFASQYSQNSGRSSLGPGYTEPVSMSDYSQAYTSSTIGRRRSSEAGSRALGATQHATRPRANTSFSDMYRSTQDATDYAQAHHLPSSVQAPRDSWDISASLRTGSGSIGQDPFMFLRSEPGSISQDNSQSFQYELPTRQNSLATHPTQESAHPNLS